MPEAEFEAETERAVAVAWWVGDWWAFGERKWGQRKAVVVDEDWDGPGFQTCMDCGWVAGKFETSRRREVLSFTHHKEVAALPTAEADALLDFDYGGKALICSNSAGKNPDNFFYNICTEARYGFAEYHATSSDNPLLPKLREGETEAAWLQRRERYFEDLKAKNDPLVYAQEYLAEFVDWSGVAFFSREKLPSTSSPFQRPACARVCSR